MKPAPAPDPIQNLPASDRVLLKLARAELMAETLSDQLRIALSQLEDTNGKNAALQARVDELEKPAARDTRKGERA